MEQGTIVRHKKTGKEGVVVNDTWGCCCFDETPVVFWGENSYAGTDTKDIEEIGKYKASADFLKCGAGRDADCCIFLTAGPGGACCERFSSLRNQLIFKKEMNAKRNPPEPFPDCMIFKETKR